jgi:hypothetical protein
MSSLLGEDIDTLKYFFYDEMFCILRNILDFCVTRLQIVYKVYIVSCLLGVELTGRELSSSLMCS